MRAIIHIVFLVVLTFSLNAQDLELANEYFQKDEFDKAKYHYELFFKKKSPLRDIYPKYVQTLVKLGELPTADKFFKRIIKENESNGIYKIDYLIFLKDSKSKDFSKQKEKTIKQAIEDASNFSSVVQYLLNKREYELLDSFISEYRKSTNNRTAFYREQAEAKKLQGQSRKMSEELLIGFLADNESIDVVKNLLQNYLTEPTELEYFQQLLLERSQTDPQNTTISELLLWLFIQQKDFVSASIHAKALDKRLRLQGDKQKEVGELALENKDYDAAITIFESLIKDYPKSSVYHYARGKYLNTKEQKIKSKFPVDQTALMSLVNDYQQLIAESSKAGSTNSYKYEADLALLYGFYLNKLDSAIALVNHALKQSQFDKRFQAQTRLYLGDLYLLDNQPWESTLLYSQVESMEKDQILGHEAKLRNAKLYYYQGEFQLAQEQMDVLKLATSREISNDAIQLSVLIQDNTAEDTTGYALKKYATIELLIFQNKWDEAKTRLEELYTEYRAASLKDDILFLQGKIYQQFGDFTNAIQKLETILQNHNDDILADDATFQIAQIYDYKLKENAKAMDYYNKIITQYPSSIHVVEARKKYRQMRGDKLN